MTTPDPSRIAREGSLPQTRHLVVGFDGSPPAGEAVAWAAAEANLLDADLHIVLAAFYPAWIAQSGDLAPGVPQPLVAAVEGARHEAERLAAKTLDRSRVTSQIVNDNAGSALTKASETAAAVVVGHRGRGAVTSALLGSVSVATVTHARCTVVVVRGAPGPRPAPRVVIVGVDGSSSSDKAVEYAAAFAARRHAPLHVVAAWQEAPVMGWESVYWEAKVLQEWEQTMAAQAEKVAATAAEQVRRAHPGLEVTAEAVNDRPIDALVRGSADAELVVVGARGLGGFQRLLLGSVSRGVLHRASSSVAVVR